MRCPAGLSRALRLTRALASATALVFALAVRAAPTPDPVYVLDHGDFTGYDGDDLPPHDDAPWHPVTLPDNWYLSHSENLQVVWYRLTVDLPYESFRFPHFIYLERNSAKLIFFYVNGLRVGSNEAYGDPGARNWAPPLLVAVSPVLVKPGRNVLHLKVVAVPGLRQGLTRVVLAQGASGTSLYEARYAEQVTTFLFIGVAALISGLLALGFWVWERRDTTLLWFALTAFAWAAAAAVSWDPLLAVAAFGQGPVAFVARFGHAAPMLVLCLRVAGKRWPWIEAVLWLFTLTGLGLASIVGEEHQGVLITAWSVAYLAALFALLTVLIRSQGHRRRWGVLLLAVALGCAVLLDAHDLAWWMGRIDYDSLQLSHFHVPLVLSAIGATIIDRHFQAVAAVERSKAELEVRVSEKAREIEASYAQVREAEREKTLARERQRIMADIHDGLGSSLIGLLGTVRSGKATLPEVERRLHDSLQELRLAVDALEPMDDDLRVVLGNVRHRMRAAIEESGVRFHWRVDELPSYADLTPKSILAIQRIVLEALNNSLRHARARDVTVSARVDERWLQIEVSDNGVGFDEAGIVSGRGLKSLRQRARGLGGTIDIRSSLGSGTDVTLRLPLD